MVRKMEILRIYLLPLILEQNLRALCEIPAFFLCFPALFLSFKKGCMGKQPDEEPATWTLKEQAEETLVLIIGVFRNTNFLCGKISEFPWGIK